MVVSPDPVMCTKLWSAVVDDLLPALSVSVFCQNSGGKGGRRWRERRERGGGRGFDFLAFDLVLFLCVVLCVKFFSVLASLPPRWRSGIASVS